MREITLGRKTTNMSTIEIVIGGESVSTRMKDDDKGQRTTACAWLAGQAERHWMKRYASGKKGKQRAAAVRKFYGEDIFPVKKQKPAVELNDAVAE